MSDYASFMTEIIPCDDCLKAVRSVILAVTAADGIELFAAEDSGPLGRVVAGSIRSKTVAGPIDDFEELCTTEISPLLCHSVRVVVIDEDVCLASVILNKDVKLTDRAGQRMRRESAQAETIARGLSAYEIWKFMKVEDMTPQRAASLISQLRSEFESFGAAAQRLQEIEKEQMG